MKKSKKTSVLFVFFKKNIFGWLKIGKKKTDMFGIKKLLIKNIHHVENDKKKEKVFTKNACWNKRWLRQYDSTRKFAKKKEVDSV